MSAILTVRHAVADYDAWRSVYDGEAVGALHAKYGVSNARVSKAADDANDVFVTHDFTSTADAAAFAADPDLQAVMADAGVAGPPRIEIFELA
jgi:hypothetical protein